MEIKLYYFFHEMQNSWSFHIYFSRSLDKNFNLKKFQLFRNTANQLTTPPSIGRNEKEKRNRCKMKRAYMKGKKKMKKKKKER